MVGSATLILLAALIYAVPDCEERNAAGYSVTVDGEVAPVSAVRNSAMPVNIRWPGHQRELDQTEIDGMVRCAASGSVRVEVTAPRDFREVRVRPRSKSVVPAVKGRTASFTVPGPGFYSVEFDGIHRNLHLFVDPPVDCRVDKSVNTVYYGPGVHEAGVIELKSGQTLFIDEGAVVFGRVYARDADNIAIRGRGILDMSRIRERTIAIDPKLAEEQRKKGFAITNAERWDAVRLEFCDSVTIDGITIRDSLCYNIRPVGCRNLAIRNVKICGNWRYNSDGIDMHNCENVRISDCFIRTFDDSICVKGFDYTMDESEMLHDGYRHDVFTNAVIERCTVWCDWGRALEFGAETRAREIADITFRDCDVIRAADAACEVQNCDYADIHGILFDDIRVELDSFPHKVAYSASAKDFDPKARGWDPLVFGSVIHVIAEYSKGDVRRGRNRDITLRDFQVTGPSMPRLVLRGYDAEHRATGLRVDGFRWNGRDISEELARHSQTNAFADPPRVAERDDFLSKGVVVSDTNRFTCGSAPCVTVSEDGRTFYTPFLTSTTGFGECHDIAAVAEFPVADPKAAKSHVICKVGERFCGLTVSSVLSFVSFPWRGNVRVTLDVNYGVCGWRDWDPRTKKVVGEGRYKCRFAPGAKPEFITPEALTRYLNGRGFTGHNVYRERGDRLLCGAKPCWDGKAFYGFATSSCSQPVLYRCEDGETLDFVGVVPEICEYECQVTKLDGVLYAYMRGSTNDNFFVSRDGGRTFRASGRLPDGKQRPQLQTWRGKVLLSYSAPDEKPNGVRNGRNNLHMLWGEGGDLSKYREILHAIDPLGIVYYDIVDLDGELHILWSNAGRFPNHVKWGAVQGKDQVLYAPLTELSR